MAVPEAPLPEEIREELSRLGGRARPEAVRDVVVRLCTLRAFTLGELAEALDRTPKHVYRHYLRPLLAAGLIAYTYPLEPRHPKQAYLAVAGRP